MRHYNLCLAFTPASSLLRCWKPRYPSSSCTPSSHHAVAFQQQHHRQYTSRHLGIMHEGAHTADEQINGGLASSELEIEKKFAIPDAETANKMKQTLTSLGFQISLKEEFVDWYFDLPAPHWHFSLQDCWFRYRERKVKIMNNWGWRGAWQVKRGKKEEHGGIGARENDGMTVYEELQGKHAKALILDMLAKLNGAEALDTISDPPPSAINSHYSGYDIPYLAGAESLVPFARLETFRTSYETTDNDGEFCALKVDIDITDFGYMVGEVEAVLNDVSEDKAKVEAAKEKIRKLVDLISSSEDESDASTAALGKLEFYLINNHRDHYDACVKSGVMMN